MCFKENYFEIPARMWLWILSPLSLLSLGSTCYFLIKLFENKPDMYEKTLFLVCFACFLIFVYLLIGYFYLTWATPLKNRLVTISRDYPNILIFKFNRVFVNEVILHKIGLDPTSFNWLSQKDLREVSKYIQGVGKRR